MPKTKTEKQKIIEGLEKKIKTQKSIIFVDFSNLDSKSLFDLRERLEESKCLLQVAKKTLLEKTLEKLGKKTLAEKIKQIKTQLALVFGLEDEIVPAKVCYQFSQENENLKILGGVFNEEFLEKEKVIELAQLPSKQELLSRFIGSLKSPISNIKNVLEGNIKGLICVLDAIKSTKTT